MGAGVLVGAAEGEQIARGGPSVFHLDAADDRKHFTDCRPKMTLQALSTSGLGEGKLCRRMHGAEMVLHERRKG